MNDAEHTVKIRSQPDIVTAVNLVQKLAAEIGMNDGSRASIATAASELVTNVLKYAQIGIMTCRSRKRRNQPGLEVIVEDFGPGIDDIGKAMTDNVSTGGSLGLGLPGAKRLVDEFEISSEPGQGTRVRLVKWG
jgi:serine/threonine-protein kinase RsbT